MQKENKRGRAIPPILYRLNNYVEKKQHNILEMVALSCLEKSYANIMRLMYQNLSKFQQCIKYLNWIMTNSDRTNFKQQCK